MFKRLIGIAALALSCTAQAQPQPQPTVVDLPTRPGVTQRMLVITPPEPKAAVVLLAGGHGGLQIFPNGSFKWGEGNFLVRSRQLFADKGLMTVVVDAPSDRQRAPFLNGFRQTAEHVADLQATIAWLKTTAKVPVWLVGTSRGTQSAAYAATVLQGADAPDGVVLTASILSDDKQRPVTAMPLEKVQVPVLVVHHQHGHLDFFKGHGCDRALFVIRQDGRRQHHAIGRVCALQHRCRIRGRLRASAGSHQPHGHFGGGF